MYCVAMALNFIRFPSLQALRKACSQATDFHIFLCRDFFESLNLWFKICNQAFTKLFAGGCNNTCIVYDIQGIVYERLKK